MPLIWCAISGHGFGHAAQVVPVLNALSSQVRDLKAILRTEVPQWFFEGRLQLPWELSVASQDIGCVQRGPLTIDVPETWAAYARLHADWDRRVTTEDQAVRAHQPDLVLSDISYLAVEAGARARLPTVALSNLSWDRVLTDLTTPADTDGQATIIRHIEQSYSQADRMIRIAPGIPLPAFHTITDVGPVTEPQATDSQRLRATLDASTEDRIVLVAFGGIPLEGLPFDQLNSLSPYRFIVSQPVPGGYNRVHSSEQVPLPFGSLLASVDIILTKPGYSTIVQAIALSQPVVYVRRYNFADEAALVTYARQHGRAVELSEADFKAGRWARSLDAVWGLPRPQSAPPPATGATEAAGILAKYF